MKTEPYTIRVNTELKQAAETKEDAKILRRRIAILVEKHLTKTADAKK